VIMVWSLIEENVYKVLEVMKKSQRNS